VSDCLHFGLTVSTPSIALCLAMAQAELHECVLAAATRLIEEGKTKDPRIWHIRAGARYLRAGDSKHSDYLASAGDYKMVLRLIEASDNPEHKKHKDDAIVNLADCLFELNRFNEACAELATLSAGVRQSDGVCLQVSALIEMSLEKALAQENYTDAALLCLTLCDLCDRYTVFTRGLLLTLFNTCTEHLDLNRVVSRIRVVYKQIPVTAEDYYHKGLLHYITGCNDHQWYYDVSLTTLLQIDHTPYEAVVRLYCDASRDFTRKWQDLCEVMRSTDFL
jgi:hypothetical protein